MSMTVLVLIIFLLISMFAEYLPFPLKLSFGEMLGVVVVVLIAWYWDLYNLIKGSKNANKE